MMVVEQLQAGYGPTPVLFDIGFTVQAGEVVALLGRNGMGKTATIGAIIGRRCWDICIPPEPYGVNVAEIAGAANR